MLTEAAGPLPGGHQCQQYRYFCLYNGAERQKLSQGYIWSNFGQGYDHRYCIKFKNWQISICRYFTEAIRYGLMAR